MAREDWYRNKEWNSIIAEAFSAKLKRARDKPQYLRIQASYLTEKYPTISLDLLDQYFALGEHFDHSQASVDRAEAYIALGQIDNAVAAYEAALAYEAVRTNVLTQAYLSLPFLVATKQLSKHYVRAVEILNKHKDRLMFPVDRFKWFTAQSLIASISGRPAEAAEFARNAVVFSKETHSGFRYHPSIGLVGNEYDLLIKQLARVAA